MPARYDLVLKGGRVIDPASGVDGIRDIAIKDGRVAKIAGKIPRNAAAEVIDVRDRLVLPGLIDTHAHVFEHVSGRFGLHDDMVLVCSGTTSVVDQGGPSSKTFHGFP